MAADSSLSLINLRDEWFLQDRFFSTGKGLNYGVELTVEKYLSAGTYWLLTGSLYSARYRGGDGIWRNNRTAMSHEIGLKMLNATFYSEYLDHQYNFKTGRVDVYCDGISMPNLYYKIEF